MSNLSKRKRLRKLETVPPVLEDREAGEPLQIPAKRIKRILPNTIARARENEKIIPDGKETGAREDNRRGKNGEGAERNDSEKLECNTNMNVVENGDNDDDDDNYKGVTDGDNDDNDNGIAYKDGDDDNNDNGVADENNDGNDKGVADGDGDGNDNGVVDGDDDDNGVANGNDDGNDNGVADGDDDNNDNGVADENHDGNDNGVADGDGDGNDNGVVDGDDDDNYNGVANGNDDDNGVANRNNDGNDNGVADGDDDNNDNGVAVENHDGNDNGVADGDGDDDDNDNGVTDEDCEEEQEDPEEGQQGLPEEQQDDANTNDGEDDDLSDDIDSEDADDSEGDDSGCENDDDSEDTDEGSENDNGSEDDSSEDDYVEHGNNDVDEDENEDDEDENEGDRNERGEANNEAAEEEETQEERPEEQEGEEREQEQREPEERRQEEQELEEQGAAEEGLGQQEPVQQGQEEQEPRENEEEEEQEPRVNLNESALDTDEEQEQENVGAAAALFQGIPDNLGMGVPIENDPGMTALDLLLVTLADSVRYNNCYEQIIGRLRHHKKSYPHINMPTSKKALWRILGRDKSNLVIRFYCSICKEKIGKGSKILRTCGCGACGPKLHETNVATFIQVRLQPQLQDLLKIPNMAETLRYRDTRVKIDVNNSEDIYDGVQYKLLRQPGQFLANDKNYSLTLWTDGVKVAESGTTVAYPIVLQLNELPPHARKKHMILAGIYVGNEHPDINKLLIPVVSDLTILYNDGVRWSPSDREEVISKFITLLFASDSVSRCDVLMMKQYNGQYGCTFCTAPGHQIGMKRIYPARVYNMRTDESIRTDALEATLRPDISDKHGVKGFSALAGVPQFNLVRSVAADSLHNSFEGGTKQFITMILTDKDKPWYVGDPQNLRRINSRLLKIKTPTKLARRPQSISKFRNWKASEWRNFALYFSLPCLDGILPAVYLEHWAKFCQATYIYNNSSISDNDLILAKNLMKSFVKNYERYGMETMSYNIHLLSHQCLSVEDWGPLWGYTTFIFESLNQSFVNNITSPNHRADQIVTRFFMKKFIAHESAVANISETSKEEIKVLLKASKLNVPVGMSPGNYIVGDGRSVTRRPKNSEIRLLRAAGFQIDGETLLNVYKKAIIHGVDYQVSDNVNRKFCNSVVYCQSGFWIILRFFTYDDGQQIIGGFIGKKIQVMGRAYRVDYIKRIRHTEQKAFVCYRDVISPAIMIESFGVPCAIPLSTIWETD